MSHIKIVVLQRGVEKTERRRQMEANYELIMYASLEQRAMVT